MQHTPTLKVDSVAIRALATQQVDDAREGDEVACSWCGRSTELVPSQLVSTSERDEMIESTIRLFEHCAFDHSGRCDVIKVTRAVLCTWEVTR